MGFTERGYVRRRYAEFWPEAQLTSFLSRSMTTTLASGVAMSSLEPSAQKARATAAGSLSGRLCLDSATASDPCHTTNTNRSDHMISSTL